MTVPWPGEQLDFYDWVKLAGPVIVNDYPGGPYYVWRAKRPVDDPGAGTSATINAGSDFYLYSDYPRLMKDSTDVIGEANWIFDVTDLTGDAQVYIGYDVNWNYDDAAIAAGWVPVTTPLVVGRNVIPLPTEYRTFDALYNNGAPLFRVVVTSGSLTATRLTLQIEPPGGLQQVSGYTLSDWMTPPTQFQGAQSSARHDSWQSTTSSEVASPGHLYTGAYNDGYGTSGLNLTVSPTWKEVANEALAAIKALPFVQDWSAPAYSSSFRPSTGWSNLRPNTTSLHISDFTYYVTIQSISRISVKAIWSNITTVRAAVTTGLKAGRDFILTETNKVAEYDGDSTSVGWEPGYLVPEGRYTETYWDAAFGNERLDNTHASPHGDSFSISGSASQGIAGAAFPNNPARTGGSWAVSDVSAVSLAPPPGSDILLTPNLTVDSLENTVVAPLGTYETTYPNYIKSVFSGVGWEWCRLQEGRYYPGMPRLLVQPPNYRFHIPTYEPSPDAVVAVVPPDVHVLPGTFLTPNPNIDGGPGEVRVYFATS